MGRLIDVAKLEARVKGHLGEINLHHITHLDTINLLCDKLDEMDYRLDGAHNTIQRLESGKPTWMDKDE
jgi:hypothetical protein